MERQRSRHRENERQTEREKINRHTDVQTS